MNSPSKIELNGTLITGRVDGLEQFQVTYRKNDESGAIVKSYSSELTFYDDGYSILKAQLIDVPTGYINEVNVKVYDECCNNLVFEGIIKGDAIDWCEPICSISANIVERNAEADCIKSTLIYEGEDFLSRNFKKLRYCVDTRPEFIFGVLILIFAILNIVIYVVLIPLSLVVVVIQSIGAAICNIVCAIPFTDCTFGDCAEGEWTNPTGAFSEISGWFDDLQNRMINCGWYHPTPLVRDYIKNVCDKCGLQFQSSILNDPASPYYNLLMFAAQIRKGYKPSASESKLIKDNLPVETLRTLFENYLNPTFNARFWIYGGKLIFERKDYFDNQNVWIDAEAMLINNEIIDNRICFSWIDEERPAFAEYSYMLDAVEFMGNESKERFNDIVEWNNPFSAAQSGKLELMLQHSTARFRGDRVSWGNFEQYANDTLVNGLFGNAFSENNASLLMNQHTAFNYKFLIWDEASGDDQARVKTNYGLAFTTNPVRGDLATVGDFILIDIPLPPDVLFNYPMSFNADCTNNLYSLFHYIDNPRTGGAKRFNFDLRFQFDCNQFESFDFNKTVRMRKGSAIVYGEVQEVVIDFMKRIITVKGIV